MDRFIHLQNLSHFRKQLADTTDASQRQQILKLLAEEEAKDPPPEASMCPATSELQCRAARCPAKPHDERLSWIAKLRRARALPP